MNTDVLQSRKPIFFAGGNPDDRIVGIMRTRANNSQRSWEPLRGSELKVSTSAHDDDQPIQWKEEETA
jgi:hypothetical protein